MHGCIRREREGGGGNDVLEQRRGAGMYQKEEGGESTGMYQIKRRGGRDVSKERRGVGRQGCRDHNFPLHREISFPPTFVQREEKWGTHKLHQGKMGYSGWKIGKK